MPFQLREGLCEPGEAGVYPSRKIFNPCSVVAPREGLELGFITTEMVEMASDIISCSVSRSTIDARRATLRALHCR